MRRVLAAACAPRVSLLCVARTAATPAAATKEATTTAAAAAATTTTAAATSAMSTEKIDALARDYAQLTLKELSMLQRSIFKQLGHSDEFYEKALLRGLGGGGGGAMVMPPAAAMAAAAAAAGAAAAGDGGAAAAAAGAEVAKAEKKKVEKNTYDVKLGPYAAEIKIKLIKELRTVTSMSIADAKKAVESCPGLVAKNMSKDDAEKLKTLFEKLGAKVELL